MIKFKATKSKYLRGKDNSDEAQRAYHERQERKYERLSANYSRIVAGWNRMLAKTDPIVAKLKKESIKAWRRKAI